MNIACRHHICGCCADCSLGTSSWDGGVTLCDVVMAALGHVMWAASVRWPSHAARAVGRVVHDRESHMDIMVDVIYYFLV